MQIYNAEEFGSLSVIRDQFIELASEMEVLQLEIRKLKNEVEKLTNLKKLEELRGY